MSFNGRYRQRKAGLQVPVTSRQKSLHTEYMRKALQADVKYNGCSEESATGPVRDVLRPYGRVHGFVFGAFGEVSVDMRNILYKIIEYKAERQWKRLGAQNFLQAKATELVKAKRYLGVEATRTYVIMLLDGRGKSRCAASAMVIQWRDKV